MRQTIVRGLVRACLLALVLFSPSLVAATSVAGRGKAGNRLYREGKYDQAFELYRKAEALSPDSPAVNYNIANTYFRKKEYEKAHEHYRRAFSAPEGALAQGARFNAGNAQFARKKWADAIRNYKEALRLNSSDPDAKKNLELALRALRQQQKQQPPRQQRSRQEPPKDQKNDQKQQPPQQTPQDEKGDKSPKPPDANELPQGAQDRGKEKEKLSREEAMRILDAMKDQDRPPRERLKVRPPDQHPKKDW
ncbi:MAG: tetratricopeptide repeat protein [Acidobacteriota bacterium]